MEVERHNIDVKLQSLSKADDSFNETIGIIFDLASKAHELFKSSEIEEKRRIIALLFPNLKMDGEKLVFSLRKPFDMFVKQEKHPDWLGLISRMRTEYSPDIRVFREIFTSSSASNLMLKVA